MVLSEEARRTLGVAKHAPHDSANPRQVPMFPRPPAGPAPAAQRGGFFRSLNFFKKQTNVLSSEFEGMLPTSEDTASPHSPHSDDFSSLQDQQAKQSLAASLFLDKLNLKLLEQLWAAIKDNCMNKTDAARGQGVYEAISLPDFLRLTWQQIQNKTKEDEQFLERLFRCVDRRKKGSVRTTDIATALVLICDADPNPREKDGLSKLKTLFLIFDSDDDGCLTHDEIFDMYLSIKVNDVTKTRQALIADITFDDELSLHEAKRLFELTIELLNVVSDIVNFEEIKKVFDLRPSLIHDLLPGAFSLDWILTDYRAPVLETNTFGSDVRKGLIDAMRRGEEHLDLTKKRGRGMRIMQNCLNSGSRKPIGDEEQSQAVDLEGGIDGGAAQSSARGNTDFQQGLESSAAQGRRPSQGNLPKIVGATKAAQARGRRASKQGGQHISGVDTLQQAKLDRKQADQRQDDDEELEDEDSDEDDVNPANMHGGAGSARGFAHGTHGSAGVPGGASRGHGGGGARVGLGKVDLPPEALDLTPLKVLPLNHTHAMRFRMMTLDAKTQQAYLRDKKDVNRSLKYQCLVCAVNHDFRLNKFAGSTCEHQHG